MSNKTLKVNVQKKLKEFDLEVDFKLKKGCLGILGPSGCGKSMTLKSIAGIVNPDEGIVSLTTPYEETVYYDSSKKINMNKGLNKGKKMSFFCRICDCSVFYMYKTHIKYKIILLQLAVKHINNELK